MRKEEASGCRAGRGVFRGSKTRVLKAPGVRHGVGVGPPAALSRVGSLDLSFLFPSLWYSSVALL